jgi:uncharacterized protein YbbC (DUF1343 family)
MQYAFATHHSLVSRRALLTGLASFLGGSPMHARDRGPTPRVVTGAARLAADGFASLRGQRVGLLTNHTGLVGSERLIDLMARAPGVTLAAILTPEHGLTGTAEAGAKVVGGVDVATGIKVHSLYGSAYKPTPEILAGLDVLVFDMQDIGTRFYTYISTMGLAMQAAAVAGLPFVVLDRPNPLGGDYVSGFVLEKAHASFVGRFEIPIAHGLTVGELARMIKGERLLPGLDGLAFDVVTMEGWRRDMRWPETGLPWVPTSPNIPTFETALAYAGTGLFEATIASEGRGTETPFLLIGHPAVDAGAIARQVMQARLRGLRIETARAKPRLIPGVATSPRFRGQEVEAVRLSVSDASQFQAVEAGIHLLVAFSDALRAVGAGRLVTDAKAFDRLAGGSRLRAALEKGVDAKTIIASWQTEVARFSNRRNRYLTY